MTVANALTIDVEDWFHILDLKNGPRPEDYDSYESRVEANTERALEILAEHQVTGTFFIVGWVAERFPALVRRIDAAGHEIGSHSWGHTLAYEMSPDAFREDTARSLAVLQDLIGARVYGYRSPGASITPDNVWCLDVLLDLGFVYDSSVYPGVRGHGGLPGAPRFPYRQATPSGRSILEVPSSCFQFLGRNIGFAGGGYLRFFPYALIRRWMGVYHRENQPVNVYLHPRELDVDHPRLRMPMHRRFKSYVNLRSAEIKLHRLLNEYQFAPIRRILGLGEDAGSEQGVARAVRLDETAVSGGK